MALRCTTENALVAIGLMAAGIHTIARISLINVTGVAIAAIAFALLLWRRMNPAVLVVAGGAIYGLFAKGG